MMRSFVTLARTLNLSQAVRELGSTRQTLRRHIALLEEYKGGPLFSLHERQYHLSPLGRDSLSEAKRLLRRVDAWLHNETTEQGGLLHQQIQDGSASFLLQQHPLSEIWAQGAHCCNGGCRPGPAHKAGWNARHLRRCVHTCRSFARRTMGGFAQTLAQSPVLPRFSVGLGNALPSGEIWSISQGARGLPS